MRYRARFWVIPILMALVAGVLGLVVMLLWNAVMPAVFAGSRPMDYPHALGLLVLSRILFGGFRGRGGWRQRRHWRRWEAMTPEEREQYKQTGRRGCAPTDGLT
jgi:hypothetical protein